MARLCAEVKIRYDKDMIELKRELDLNGCRLKLESQIRARRYLVVWANSLFCQNVVGCTSRGTVKVSCHQHWNIGTLCYLFQPLDECVHLQRTTSISQVFNPSSPTAVFAHNDASLCSKSQLIATQGQSFRRHLYLYPQSWTGLKIQSSSSLFFEKQLLYTIGIILRLQPVMLFTMHQFDS